MKSIFLFLFMALGLAITSCKNDNAAASTTMNNESAPTGAQAVPAGSESQAAPSGNPNETTVATGPTTTIKLDNSSFNFGKVKEGTLVETTIKVTNTGKEPLVLTNCHASCGCTTSTCPKEPIAPGQSVDIPVKFDSKGKPGHQRKEVTITANTLPAQTKFVVEGDVERAEM